MSSESDVKRRRNHVIRVRMSDEEYEDFQNKLTASGQTMQSYVLNAVQTGVIPDSELLIKVSELSQIMAEEYKQLRGIGANINQMAYNSNLEKLTGDWQAETRLQEMQEQICEMKERCMESWQSLRQLMAENRLTGH